MSTLQKRLEALEARGAGALVLLLISRVPSDGDRETATYEGVTYTQAPSETQEQFRTRLGECLSDGKKRFLWVSELDGAL